MSSPLRLVPDLGRGIVELAPELAGAVALGPLAIERLELATPPGVEVGAELARWQRWRTRLERLALRVDQAALDRAVAARREPLARAGVGDPSVHIGEGVLVASARIADGLASADVSFQIALVPRGRTVHAIVGAVRVHGHLPTPGPLIAQRMLEALIGGVAGGSAEPEPIRVAGLLDLELDLASAVLWKLLPAAGWRLPAYEHARLARIAVGAGAIAVELAGDGDEVPPPALGQAWATAHAAMASADELLRRGQLEDAMRGYRALLAAAGPDQPALLERILAVASARPGWFVDGRELARQALARWPEFVAAHAALASIALAEGDTREAAARLATVAQVAGRHGDRDGAALSALAAARLYRVIDPPAATALYQRALSHRGDHREAESALIERYADEARWRDLIAVLEARAARLADGDPPAAAADWARAARIAADQLGDLATAAALVARAQAAAPIAPAYLAAAAVAAARGDRAGADAAYRQAAAVAAGAGDDATQLAAAIARARLLDDGDDADAAAGAWDAALAVAPRRPEVLAAAAGAAARVGDHRTAIARLRQLLAGHPDDAAAALALGDSLLAIGERAEAEAALERAATGPAAIAAEALARLAAHRDDAAELLGRAIALLTDGGTGVDGAAARARAAELALQRADRVAPSARRAELERAVALADGVAPAVVSDAAHALLWSSASLADGRRWLDALLAATPAPAERAALLGERARRALAEPGADLAAAAADAQAAAALVPGTPAALDALAIAVAIERQRGDARSLARSLDALAAAQGSALAAETAVEAAEAHLAADGPARALALAQLAVSAQAAEAVAAASFQGAARDTFALIAHDGAGDAPASAAPAAPMIDVTRELFVRAHRALGEAAWRQRAFPEVVRAYQALLSSPEAVVLADDERAAVELRLAQALERAGDAGGAIALLTRAAPRLPGDAKGQAYRLLADLHERRGAITLAAAALEAYADAADAGTVTATARADALYRAGELFRRRPGHATDAVRCLDAALRLVDDHLPALDALELIERDLGDLDRVATIIGRKIAASARQPSRQKALLCRLAAIHIQLERPDVARVTLARALEIDPGYRPALHALAEVARARGQRVELAEALAAVATSGGDDGDAARDRAAAAIELSELIASDPEAQFAPAWRDRTIAILESLGATVGGPALAAAAERLRSPGAPLTRSAAPRHDAAEVARAAGRLDEARALLQGPAAAGDPRALRDLADVCAELGDWDACAAALAALAGARVDPPLHGHRRAEVLLELADVYYDRIGDVERARATMRDAADAHGPSARRDATLRLLAAEAASADDHGDAAAALTAIAPERRTVADTLALATAWQRRGNEVRAIATLEEVEAAGKLSDEGAMLLFALHQERRRKADLAAALERGAGSVPPHEARARLTDALGLYRDALGDLAGAARMEAALAALPPAPPPAATAAAAPSEPRRRTARPTEMERLAEAAAAGGDHKAAADLYADAIAARVRAGSDPVAVPAAIERVRAAARAAGHADALVRALFAVAARAPKPLAVDLYREAAATARADLADEAIACDALIRAHRLAPGDGELVAALADALESEGDLTRLADVYERAAAHASGNERGRWLLALALLARDKLGDPQRARIHLDAAFAAAPDLPTIWMPLADARIADDDVAGAHELYERVAASVALDPTTRAWASERVAALERAGGEGVTAGEIASPQSPAQTGPITVAARTRTAPLGSLPSDGAGAHATGPHVIVSHATGPHAAAPPTAAAAPEPAPGDSGAFAAGPMQDTRRITLRGLTALRTPREDVPELERELRLGAELAAAGQPEAAIAHYEAASLLAGPGDQRALVALESLYDARGDGEAVSDVIGRQIVATAEPRPRARLWWRRAQLYRDVLHREADTYRCLKEAHACDPDDLDIAYELRAVAMARGEWALTAELLGHEIASATSARDRGALNLELALVFDEKLLDPDAARRHYEAALADDPTIPAVPRPLARIYELAGRYRDAATMLEEAARLAPTGERAALLARAAADAARAGERGRAVQLAHGAADAALAAGNHEAAARARAEAARLGADPPRDESHARDAAARELDLQRAVAEGDGAAMDSAARGVLALSPAHPQAFRILYERAEARADWAAAAELTAARAAAESDPTDRASQWFELGRLHADKRGDLRAARTAWTRALDTDPAFAPALDALADLAYRERDLPSADALYARLPIATSRLPADVVMLRRSEIAEALGDDARALQLAQNAARLGPSRRDIYTTCARLAGKVGDLEAAIRASRSALELIVADDIAALGQARFELAELCKKAGDTIGAVYYHELVVADDPQHARSLEALSELYVERGNWAGAARALRALGATASAPDRKAALLYRLGELTLSRLGDAAGADAAFLRAADLDPNHLPTLRRLIDVYWRAGDAPALLEVAQELAAAGNLVDPATGPATLARVAVAAASAGAMNLAAGISRGFGADGATRLAAVLVELVGRTGELSLEPAVAAVIELHRRGQGPAPAAIAAATQLLGVPGATVTRALGV